MTSVRLQLLRRQLLSSALTPSLQYEAAAFRLHALTESMCLFSPTVIRLIRSLHLIVTSFTAALITAFQIYDFTSVIIDEEKPRCQGERGVFCYVFFVKESKANIDKSITFC